MAKVSRWIEGAPEKGWLGGMKLKGRRALDVSVWRCIRCGFLESYARAQ